MNATNRFIIRRIDRPSWPTGYQEAISECGYDTMGQQAEWGFAIPWMYRALASPKTYEPVLRAPRSGEAPYGSGSYAYWTSLVHLLVYNLGWFRPHRGLRWWYGNGKPQDDHYLAFLAEVWDADGTLDWFAASIQTERLLYLAPVTEVTGRSYEDDQAPLIDTFAEALLTKLRAERRPELFSSPKQFHLPVHVAGPLEAVDARPRLLQASPSTRQAVLFVDSMHGWYRALVREGAKLATKPGQPAWRVDVVAKPVGWLGTYRRSAVTGLWYCGRHHTHIQGA